MQATEPTTRPAVHVVDDPGALGALGHPVRLRILDELRAPASAATVARAIGQSRQNVGHHLKELERAGLVRRAGERRVGAFVESLYEAVAPTVLVSPRAVWGGVDRATALHNQVALEELVLAGERLTRDAAALLDRAAFDGEEVPSASVEVTVTLRDEDDRASFLRDYLTAVKELARRHGHRTGVPFRVALAAYPAIDQTDQGATT